MTNNSLLYWTIAAFLVVLVFGAIAYPSTAFGKLRKKRSLKILKSTNNLLKDHQKENQSEDKAVLSHIKRLTLEEDELNAKENLTDAEIKKFHQVKLELDQYWDLLMQRKGTH
jgi:Protein of unknown function (DUF2630)